ncbi:kinase-like protein [Rhizophagus irregularis]|uniref:Kinase-like protein n=1 Tax=Rhizophagus irregularis TaxID=588596 RepID=A0A2I1HGI6_9GLOM|nr:kinase-like protein [Rhizophagus irregularis]
MILKHKVSLSENPIEDKTVPNLTQYNDYDYITQYYDYYPLPSTSRLLQSPSSQYPPPSTPFHFPPTTCQTYTCILPSSPFPLPPRPCQTYTCNPPSSTPLPPPPPWDKRGTNDENYPQSQKFSLGWCIECGKPFSGMKWCRPCNAAHFYSQTSEWTSWRLGLDNLIIKTQITVHSFFEWIPFKNFDQVTYLAKGGYSVAHKAIWKQGPITYWDTNTNNWERFSGHEVVLKVIKGSQKNLDEFINELSAHHKFSKKIGHVLRCFGVSRWEDTGDFIVVTSYAKDGNLRQYIRKKVGNFPWIKRLITLKDIAKGLEIIHNSGYVHRDLHTGNILRHGSWTMISDLGLTWSQDSVSTDELFGVLEYMAPEILSGGQYSSASDIYSFAMIMYEIASGKIPFHHEEINPSNIIQGYRSEITFATPFIYTELMKSCWESDPKKRPSASLLVKTFDDWIHSKREQLVTIYNSFQDAEDERKNSMTDSIIYIPTIDQTSQLISIK